MNKLKRYAIEVFHNGDCAELYTEVHDVGDWCLWEDTKAEIGRLNARLKVLQDAHMSISGRDHMNPFEYTEEIKQALRGDE
jgi:hypothetical protein